MSSVQLMNYLETLSIDPSSCQGFEEEALGGCVGLVGWGVVRQGARVGWMKAVEVASMNSSGGLKAGPSNKSFFYSALKHRQHSAFGTLGFRDPDWATFDVAAYPWALPEPLFQQLYPDVVAGKGRTYEYPPTWQDVIKVQMALGSGTPAGELGKKMFKELLKKYAPRLMESAVADWAGPISAGAIFAGQQLENFAATTHNAQTKQSFEIDRRRREYDRTVGSAVAAR